MGSVFRRLNFCVPLSIFTCLPTKDAIAQLAQPHPERSNRGCMSVCVCGQLLGTLTGTRNRRTSASAYAMRACASAGAVYVEISTCRSSDRWAYRGSPLSRSSSSYPDQDERRKLIIDTICVRDRPPLCRSLSPTFFRSRIEPLPRTAILHIVSSCSRFSELPFGPRSLPTKLNCAPERQRETEKERERT